MYGLIFLLTEKTNFFLFMIKFSNVYHFYITFLDCYEVIDVAEAAFITDFFKISPERVKDVKKRFKRNKIKQIHNLNARVLKLNPKVGIPLGMNGIQFQHSSIQIVDLFDFVSHMPPSNSNFRGDCQVQ